MPPVPALQITVVPVCTNLSDWGFMPTGLPHATTPRGIAATVSLAHVSWSHVLRRQWLHRRIPRSLVSPSHRLSARLTGRLVEFEVVEYRYRDPAGCEVTRRAEDGVEADDEAAWVDTQTVVHVARPRIRPSAEQLAEFGGYRKLVGQVLKLIDIFLSQPDHQTTSSPFGVRGCLVWGVEGIGKSALLRHVAQRSGLASFRLSLRDLFELLRSDVTLSAGTTTASEAVSPGSAAATTTLAPGIIDQHIRTALTAAALSRPALVLIEDLHLISVASTVNPDHQRRIVAALTEELGRMPPAGVMLLGESRTPGDLPDSLRHLGLFRTQFEMGIPDREDRYGILQAQYRSFPTTHHDGHNPGTTNLDDERSEWLTQVSRSTIGYTARDLAALVRQAFTASAIRHQSRPTSHIDSVTADLADLTIGSFTHLCHDPPDDPPQWCDWKRALDRVRPSQNLEFDTKVPFKAWADIGGYGETKTRLQLLLRLVSEAATAASSSSDEDSRRCGSGGGEEGRVTLPRSRLGLKPPAGILLYGAPGSGKTTFAQALATESGMNTLVIRGPEVFSKYMGDTEAILRRIFAVARKLAPCIIWVDEIDTITRKRGWSDSDGTNGVDERVLSTLLNEMDGVQDRPGVLVLGCTTYPDQMDDAIIRPGRFDQLVHLPLPDNEDRRAILDVLAQRHPLASEVDLDALALDTKDFTPAHLENLFREAAMHTLRGNAEATEIDVDSIQNALDTAIDAIDADGRLTRTLGNLAAFGRSRK
ncbi:hypothetical protein IWQ60_006895 [Tieghemiomyces parasiticus]|uniref:AAA+ ATPase domain-containing protein n=1 Tax=Tieghemiomyces parasiticus TaxID=78921 RepID=A0A9W8A704_9FUNG|nr:hypothetical protein IWQ60_006895 [Tieghemiomyces parasiticus]